jgi:uncharacterized protein YukE
MADGTVGTAATAKQTDTMAQGIMALDSTATQIKNVGTTVADARAGFSQIWQGDASTQFGSAVEVWLEDLQVILKNIDDLRETLVGVDKQFTATEQDASLAAYQWVGSALNGGGATV